MEVIVVVRSDGDTVFKRVLLFRVEVEIIELELLVELVMEVLIDSRDWLLSTEAEVDKVKDSDPDSEAVLATELDTESDTDLLEVEDSLDAVWAGTVKVPKLVRVTAVAVVGTAI